jgi:hypothetical protein
VITTFGTVSVPKSHCLAPSSGKQGFRTSPYLQDLACYVGQSVPFDEGSELLAKLAGITLTDKQIERISHHYGEALEDLVPVYALPTTKDQRQHYAMMDGSMVYIRGEAEGWKELKLARVFAASDAYKAQERGVIHHSDYVAHLGGHQDFLEKFDQLVYQKTDLVAIGDGARWIWDYWTTFRPEAIQILDYFHGIEKIGEWAALVFKDEKQKKDWIEYSETLLLNDEVGELIVAIQTIDCQGDKLIKQKQLLTYLTNNQSRMLYKTFLDAGLFIGSGAIEAANKEVIQKRFKLAGQRWTRQGLQQVANLRVAHKSNQWENVRNLIKNAA